MMLSRCLNRTNSAPLLSFLSAFPLRQDTSVELLGWGARQKISGCGNVGCFICVVASSVHIHHLLNTLTPPSLPGIPSGYKFQADGGGRSLECFKYRGLATYRVRF